MISIDIDLIKRRINRFDRHVGLASYCLAQVVEAMHQMWNSCLERCFAGGRSLVTEGVCTVQRAFVAFVYEFPESPANNF